MAASRLKQKQTGSSIAHLIYGPCLCGGLEHDPDDIKQCSPAASEHPNFGCAGRMCIFDLNIITRFSPNVESGF